MTGKVISLHAPPDPAATAPKGKGGRPRSAPTSVIGARVPRTMLDELDVVVERRRQVDPAFTRQMLLHEAVGRLLAAETRKMQKRRAAAGPNAPP